MIHAGAPKEFDRNFLEMSPFVATNSSDSPYWWKPKDIEHCFETPCTFEGKPIFVISWHTNVSSKESLQNYGIMLDLGNFQKRAVEIRQNKFRTIDIKCTEIINFGSNINIVSY